jgi:hypothetical protein
MHKIKALPIILLCFLSSCENRFPTEKRFWDTRDYYNVINEIEYKTPDGEEYPRFSNPETAI